MIDADAWQLEFQMASWPFDDRSLAVSEALESRFQAENMAAMPPKAAVGLK